MTPIRFVVRRWWWRKWNPAVRVGWMITRSGPGGQVQTMAGLGLIAIGLILRSQRSRHLYTAKIDVGRAIAIRTEPPTGTATGA